MAHTHKGIVNKKFLASVANYLINSGRDLSRQMLVFPNKRSAMFMRSYLRKLQGKHAGLMPTLKTLPAFLSTYTRIVEGSSLELSFILYRCYCQIMQRQQQLTQEAIRSFDSFVFWGEMMIADFDDIDANDVNADDLFKNLKSLREIESTFLTPEQADAYQQLWGFRPPSSEDVTFFWKHIVKEIDGSTADNDSVSSSFINLWVVLGELYREFHNELTQIGIGYRGLVTQSAVNEICSYGKCDFDFDNIAFIGFNKAPKCVARCFKHFSTLGLASFFWDMPGIFDKAGIKNDGLRGDSIATYTIGRLAKQFRSPDDFEVAKDDTMPIIDVIGISSNMMQARVASAVLTKWNDQNCINTNRHDNTAVVMPDSSLLSSLLFSLPQSISTVNITMGLPYRETPFATMMHTIVSMHIRMQEVRGEQMLFHEDICNVVSNPYIRKIDSKGCDAILDLLSKQKLFTVAVDTLKHTAPKLDFVFDVAHDPNDTNLSTNYLGNLIDHLSASLNYNPEDSNNDNATCHEYMVLQAYRSAIQSIGELTDKYQIAVGRDLYFKLVERLLATQTINVSGTPLRGLQVMGVLETRALDFDNLIILSMNERIMPKKNPLKSLIPHMLRGAFGLPTIQDIESESAYYFYRLLTRAHRVALIYDSRVSGVAAGEMSRYLYQLQYLIRPDVIKFSTCNLKTTSSSERPISVTKDDAVMARLNKYREQPKIAGEKQKNLSASVLKTYLNCPLAFYLKHVCDLGEDNEAQMFMDAATYGSIVHNVLENLYNGVKGTDITDVVLQNMIDSDIKGIIAQAIDKEYYRNAYGGDIKKMPGEAGIHADIIEKIVKQTLKNEFDNYHDTDKDGKPRQDMPFKFLAAEVGPKDKTWQLTNNLSFNFTAKIDRIDQLNDGKLRFIDYKTGGDKFFVAKVDDLFNRDASKRNDAIFQLLLYCHAVHDICGCEKDIRPEIFRLKKVFVDRRTTIAIGTEKQNTIVQSYRDMCVDKFREKLIELITEIFNSNVPFTQTAFRDNCKYCMFASMCGRIVSVS